MVMEQFINVAEKKLVPLLHEKRFKTLKEAATWADDHMLVHQPVPPWIGGTSEGAGAVSGGMAGASLYGSPCYSSGSSNKSGRVSPVGNKSPPSPQWRLSGSTQHSTPRYSMQPMCHYCKNTASKTSQKPVALIVSQGWDQEGDEIWAVFSQEGGKASVAAPSYAVTSLSPVRSELDWCHKFLYQGTVEIDGIMYPATVLKDTAAQQSLYMNVTGK
ncbi:uncharacterized protein LOC135116167 [Scylla paramamosain]|uniref:uncharacterized protein LOC135116167 n=1 Tax=Scylla paramamosain TaxID=85552 RepID=UPI00308361BB